MSLNKLHKLKEHAKLELQASATIIAIHKVSLSVLKQMTATMWKCIDIDTLIETRGSNILY